MGIVFNSKSWRERVKRVGRKKGGGNEFIPERTGIETTESIQTRALV